MKYRTNFLVTFVTILIEQLLWRDSNHIFSIGGKANCHCRPFVYILAKLKKPIFLFFQNKIHIYLIHFGNLHSE